MYEYLIMGQGLAGSLLAWELIRRGRKVCVIDNGHRHASSWVAAGLINPVTGLRMVKSPHTEAWLQAAGETYAGLEQAFGILLRHDRPMWRLFTQQRQRDAWQERLADPDYADYLGPVRPPADAYPYEALHGFGVVNHTGHLDTKSLLGRMKAWLQAQNAYVEQEIAYQAIETQGGTVGWGSLEAKRMIFCEGWRGVDNPWFGHLPLTPVKGEILTLQHSGQLPEAIVNFGKWLLPISPTRFKLGATYDWEHRDQDPTAQGQSHLLEALAAVMPEPPATEVVAHEVGLRPNTRDRLPLIGAHRQFPQLLVFNGFGSKGSLMIPYYARHLADHLLSGSALASHCDIARWEA